MFVGIDHLVIAVADPDGAALDLERHLGLEATGGGRHEALGTFNRLVWLGDLYLELIGVSDRSLAERSWIGAPTVRTLEAGGGLATWAIASDALADDVAEAPLDRRRHRRAHPRRTDPAGRDRGPLASCHPRDTSGRPTRPS